MAEHWFAFAAYNTQTQYGFGSRTEADTYCDHLNAGRTINLYAAKLVADPEKKADLDRGYYDGFNLADALAGINGWL